MPANVPPRLINNRLQGQYMNNETITNILALVADLTARVKDLEQVASYQGDLIDQLVDDGKLDSEPEYTTLNSR